jgi:hypothetical protein
MIIVDEQDLLKLGVEKKIIKRIRQDAPEVVKSVEVDKNTGATLELVKAINELVKKPSEGVDLSPVVEAIYNIQESQLNVMQLLEKKMDAPKAKKFEFTVVRNAQGSIHKITAKEL